VTTSQVSSFAESMAGLEHVVGEMHADWDRRTDAAIDLVAQAGHAAVDEFRAEVRDVVDSLRASVDAGTDEVTGSKDLVMTATARLVSAGEALLGYLARRDQILEGERDRIFHDVLDAFAQGLSAKERRGMGERVGAALERRRDARDAERFRQAGSGAPAIEVPDVPADLAALAEPLPAPKKPKPPARQAAAVKTTKPAGKKAAATKAPVKKSPAKKASAAKTPAKKAASAKVASAVAKPRRAEKASPQSATVRRAPAKQAAVEGDGPGAAPVVAENQANPGEAPATKAPTRRKARKQAADQATQPAPITPAEPAVDEVPVEANTTEPLDGEGTTRV
jgi:hypothetical protein